MINKDGDIFCPICKKWIDINQDTYSQENEINIRCLECDCELDFSWRDNG